MFTLFAGIFVTALGAFLFTVLKRKNEVQTPVTETQDEEVAVEEDPVLHRTSTAGRRAPPFPPELRRKVTIKEAKSMLSEAVSFGNRMKKVESPDMSPEYVADYRRHSQNLVNIVYEFSRASVGEARGFSEKAKQASALFKNTFPKTLPW